MYRLLSAYLSLLRIFTSIWTGEKASYKRTGNISIYIKHSKNDIIATPLCNVWASGHEELQPVRCHLCVKLKDPCILSVIFLWQTVSEFLTGTEIKATARVRGWMRWQKHADDQGCSYHTGDMMFSSYFADSGNCGARWMSYFFLGKVQSLKPKQSEFHEGENWLVFLRWWGCSRWLLTLNRIISKNLDTDLL